MVTNCFTLKGVPAHKIFYKAIKDFVSLILKDQRFLSTEASLFDLLTSFLMTELFLSHLDD